MIESSEAYKKAVVAASRRTRIKAVIDISDPDIVHGEPEYSLSAEYSRPEQIINKQMKSENYYASLEPNRWMLNGKAGFLDDDGLKEKYEVGYVSAEMSGADGYFLTPIAVQINFSNAESLLAYTICFPDNDWDGIAENFAVEILSSGTVAYKKEYEGNRSEKVIGAGFRVNYPDAIRVTVSKWSLPRRHARIIEIFPGLYEEWDENNLAGFDVVHQSDISNTSLKYGTATLKVDNSSKVFEPRNKTGLFSAIEERQPVDLSIGICLPDGTDEYKRVGVFYQYAGGWATSDNSQTMTWKLVDIIGLLNNREFVPPSELPTTLGGWISATVGHLGSNFAQRYSVDSEYAQVEVIANSREDVTGKKCGEILRFACMASGTWPRAEAASGYLAVAPLWTEGGRLDLDNLKKYPTMKGNADVAALVFQLYGADGEKTQFVVGGTNAASDKTVNINNPFIHTEEEALRAARLMLRAYGGNQIETVGRGDPSSEIGDMDTVWLDGGTSETGRRVYQSLNFRNGVLTDCKSTLLQPNGYALFEGREIITESGTWEAPAGVTKLRIVLVGGGTGGGLGYDGSENSAGEKGTDGAGGKVWYGDIEINEGQKFAVLIGAGGTNGGREGFPGDATTFGIYSSANGQSYPSGYTVAGTGDTFARSGVAAPQPNTGDGGAGGAGGTKGYTDEELGIVVPPGLGYSGKKGASGVVAVYWDKEANS